LLPSELDNPQALAAAWMALALLASLVSIRFGISVALTEILFGVFAGNAFHLQSNEWINFLAGFGSIVLTFLAGAEIEPAVLRRKLSQTMAIGIVAFVAPFVGAMTFALLVVGMRRQRRSQDWRSLPHPWRWSTP